MNVPSPVQGHPTYAPLNKSNRKKLKKPITRARRIVRLGIWAIILLLIGTGIWYAGSAAGFWDSLALTKASAAWKKQPDYKQESAAVIECLNALADAIDNGDIEAALSYIDPDQAEQFRQLFTENESSLSNLVFALRNSELTFLSTEGDGYDALRMATLKATLPKSSGTSSDQTGIMITMIKLESGWVVASL